MAEELPDGDSPIRPPVAVVARSLTYWPRRGARGGKAPILDSVSFIAKPGRVLGILGASGSGKTTLLNIVAGKAAQARRGLTGSVKFVAANSPVPVDEASPSATRLSRKNDFRLGYVTASSIFPPGLTIREVVLFAARLHSGSCTCSAKKIEEATALALSSVGLSDLRLQETVAESASGVHKKRLALALEHLRRPAVILLDEPTSGLDVRQSGRIVQLLINRAQQRGETILSTIHQPRTSTLLLFDDILLLTNAGRVAYFGPPRELQAYLAALGYVLPPNDSLACFALEVVSNPTSLLTLSSGPLASPSSHGASSRVFAEAATLTSFPGSRATTSAKHSGGKAEMLASNFADSPEARRLRDDIKIHSTYPALKPCVIGGNWKTSCCDWVHQMVILLARIMLCRWRAPLVTIGVVLCAFIEALLIGLVFYRLPKYIDNYSPIQLQAPVQDVVQQLGESKWLNVALHGFNDQGYQPLLELVDYGVNGRGRSLLQSLLESPVFLPTIVNATDFLHSKFNLTQLGYPVIDSFDQPSPSKKAALPSIGSQSDTDSSDAEAYIAEAARVTAKGLQLVDYFYHRYHWASFNVCRQYWGAVKYNLCLYLELRDVIHAATKFIEWPYPASLLQVLASLENVPDWIVDGPSRRRRLLGQDTSKEGELFLPSKADEWSSEASQFLDTYGLRPLVRRTFGADLMDMIEPVTRWVEILYTRCTHPICTSFLSSDPSPAKALWSTASQFLSQSYVTMGTLLNLCGVMFFICLLLGFASYESLLTFPTERVFLNREVAGGRCRRSSYFLAKMLADLPMIVVVGSLVSLCLYFLTGFQMVGDRPNSQCLVFWAISLLVAFAAHGFAYMISAASPNSELGLLIAPLFLLIWLTIAGFFLRSNELPKWIRWFNVLSFYHWGFNAQMGNLLPDDGFFGNLPNTLNRGFAGISESSVSLCCVYLFVLGIAYRILAFVFLEFFHCRVGIEG